MAIEIKGLKAKALAARAHLDKLNQAYDKFNEMAPAHAADVEGLAEQITGMQSDLEFASTLMGNSKDASEKLPATSVVPQNILAGTGDLNQPKAAPEPPAPRLYPDSAFTHVGRVALGPHPDQPEGQQSAQGRMPEQTASQQAGSATASADPQSSGAAVLALKDAAE